MGLEDILGTGFISTTVKSLIAWSRKNMANYKVPRVVEFVDALPTNPAGKVTKFVLRDRARELAQG